MPGNPDELDRLAARLSVFGDGMSDAGAALTNVQAVGWRGPAAEAFSGLLDEQPDKYRTAGSSFTEAVGAIRSYTSVLRDAQAEAGRAVSIYEDAARASQTWQRSRSAHEDAVRSAQSAGDPPPTGPAPPSTDPGGADRAASRQLLSSAREQVRAQGQRAAATLSAAADEAPDEPGLFDKVMGGIGDFFGGVWEGIVGIAETVVLIAELSPVRMLIDPEGWARDVTDLGKGLWYGVTHPVEFAKLLVDWETWKDNPLRAFGKLIPDIAIAIATAGAGTAASRGSQAARAADDLVDVARDAERLDDIADAADAAHDAERLEDALPDAADWPVRLSPDEVAESQGYFDDLPHKDTPDGRPANVYEREQTGDQNYLLEGGGEEIWADGYRVNDAGALEAKHVTKPDRSPYVDDSALPEKLRQQILAEQEDEFRRYAEVIKDPSNPVRHLEVITNEPRAVPYFERMMEKYDIPGRVVVRP